MSLQTSHSFAQDEIAVTAKREYNPPGFLIKNNGPAFARVRRLGIVVLRFRMFAGGKR